MQNIQRSGARNWTSAIRASRLTSGWRSTIINAVLFTAVMLLYGRFAINYGVNFRGVYSLDFPSFYTASIATFNLNLSPYAPETLNQLMTSQQVFSYVYPPQSLLLFYPFSFLSYGQAQLLMLALNHVLFLLIIFMTMRILNLSLRKDSRKIALLVGYLLVFRPIMITLWSGQVSLILLALLLAFWMFARDNRPGLAGAMLALAIVLKAYPVLLLPFLLVSRRQRETLATLGWLALITAVAAVIIPATTWADWFFNVIPQGGYGRVPADLGSPALPWNQSMSGFLARLFTSDEWTQAVFPSAGGMATAKMLSYLATAAVGLISLGVVFKSRRRSPDTALRQAMMIGLPLTYLVAPLSWEHHVVHLIPAVLGLLLVASPSRFPLYTMLYYLIIGIVAIILTSNQVLMYFPVALAIWMLNCILALRPDSAAATVAQPAVSPRPQRAPAPELIAP
jgi:hypothetical protein